MAGIDTNAPGDAGLRRSGERRLQALFETSADGLVLLNAEGAILYASPAALRIVGYAEQEFVGQSLFTFLNPLDVAAAQRTFAACVAGAHGALEARLRHRDGSWRWVEGVIANHLGEPGIAAVVANIRDSSERRRIGEELKASRDELEAILRSVADGVTVQDRAGRLVYANDAAARALGFASVEALLAAPQADLGSGFNVYDEAGRAFPLEQLPARRVFAGMAEQSETLRFRNLRTREETWSLVQATPIYDAAGEVHLAVSVFHDVTIRKRTDEALQFITAASSMLASSLDYETTLPALARMSVPGFADWCLIDLAEADGSYRRIAATGVSSAEPGLGEALTQYPPRPGRLGPIERALASGESSLFTTVPDALLGEVAQDEEHLRLLRAVAPHALMVAPITARGRTLGALTFMMSRRGRRFGPGYVHVANQLAFRAGFAVDNALLYSASQTALADARAALATRDEFLSIASHELRTPLTSLRGQLELAQRRMRRGSPPAEVEQALRNAQAQADRLSRLASELVDVSRIAAGRFLVTPEPLAIRPLMQRIVELERASVPERTLTLELPPTELRANVDPLRLEQVLVNLLQNAHKYSPADRPVQVTVGYNADTMTIAVADEGIGIPEADLPQIFEPFHRAANIDRGISGLGLGLYIAHEIVAAHGGALTVASRAGEGSTFTIALPRLAD